jgi:hypothetical protein
MASDDDAIMALISRHPSLDRAHPCALMIMSAQGCARSNDHDLAKP